MFNFWIKSFYQHFFIILFIILIFPIPARHCKHKLNVALMEFTFCDEFSNFCKLLINEFLESYMEIYYCYFMIYQINGNMSYGLPGLIFENATGEIGINYLFICITFFWMVCKKPVDWKNDNIDVEALLLQFIIYIIEVLFIVF